MGCKFFAGLVPSWYGVHGKIAFFLKPGWLIRTKVLTWSEHIGAPGFLEIFIILILALSPKIGGLLKPGEVHNWQNIHWNFASKIRKASRCSSSVQLTTYIHKKRLFTCRDLPNQDSTPEPRRPFGGRSLSVCRMYTTHLLWPHTGRPHMKREMSVGGSFDSLTSP